MTSKPDIPPPPPEVLVDKAALVFLNQAPVCAETPAKALDDAITPTDRLYMRNNGRIPVDLDAQGWTLTIDGEVEEPLELSLDALKAEFEPVTYALQMECAGNGRAFFEAETPGEPWTTGAISCAAWTGVRLADVLARAKPTAKAIYTAHYGADGSENEGYPISRGIPIAKALEPHTLLAWAVNGEPLPIAHGFPLRLVVPGWPASVSHKWLRRIWIRDREHDGPRMLGTAYRMPTRPLEPGEPFTDVDMAVMGPMPVRSVITHPADKVAAPLVHPFEIRGHAWAGERTVARVDVSLDGGRVWEEAELDPPANPYAWQNWRLETVLSSPGDYEILARATDSEGETQPIGSAPWNPGGYANNAAHRIVLRAG